MSLQALSLKGPNSGYGLIAGTAPDLPCAFEAVANVAHRIFDSINRVIEPFQKYVVLKHIIQIVYVPLNVFNIFKNCTKISKDDHEKKIDAGLDTCSKIREILESIGTFVVALEAIKAIPNVWGPITLPFTAAVTILSLSSIVIKIRSCVKTVRFLEDFDKVAKNSEADGKHTIVSYERMLNLIEEKQAAEKTFVSEMFNTTEEKLTKALVKVQLSVKDKLRSGSPEDARKAQEKLDNVIGSLRGRVKQNVILSSVSIVASVVNIIGASLLLAMPLLPIGWPLLALGVIVDVGRFVYHKVGEYQFAEAIGLKRSKWEWLTC